MAYTITGLNGCTSYSVTVEGEHRCGTSNFTNVIQTMEGGLYSLLSSFAHSTYYEIFLSAYYLVPGPVPEDSEVNRRSFNESFDNLETMINTPVSFLSN